MYNYRAVFIFFVLCCIEVYSLHPFTMCAHKVELNVCIIFPKEHRILSIMFIYTVSDQFLTLIAKYLSTAQDMVYGLKLISCVVSSAG